MSLSASLYYLYKNIFDCSNQYIGILDTHSQFTYLNKKYADVIGYKSTEDALGTSYNQFKCQAVEKSNIFREQDIEVLTTTKPLTFLSYHRYRDDAWRLLYGEKSSILNEEKKLVGIFSTAQDITISNLVDISRFLIQDAEKNFGKIEQKAFTYYISKENDSFDISIKEQEVLFYFIRGKSAVEISTILCRSKRTVEMHIETLKEKLHVMTKSQLIEKSIIHGYMAKIPESLFINSKLQC